jgi:hypothetical protein
MDNYSIVPVTDIESSTLKVLKGSVAEISLRSVAAVRAKYDAYVKVYRSFETFIINQAELLNSTQGMVLTQNEKLSLAKLVWDWLSQTEAFLIGNEDALLGVDGKVREKFTEEAFNNFSPEIKEKLIVKFNLLRNDMLTKFSECVVEAIHDQESLKKE